MATIDIKLKSYDELIFEITTLNTKLFLKDKEIERLTVESTEWESKCYKYQDIIDELEKWLKENLTKDDIKNHFVVVSVIGVLEKLKELKGSDKE